MRNILSVSHALASIAVAAATLAFSPYAYAQTPSWAIRFQSVSYQLNECRLANLDWQHQAMLSGALLGAIAIFGALTAALQAAKRSWAKTVTAILGSIVTALTIVSTQAFDGDFKTLNRKAKDGDRLIRTADNWLQAKDSAATDEDRNLILDEVRKRINAFWQLSAGPHIDGDNSGGRLTALVEPVLHAQQKGCGCIESYEQQTGFVYFCGTGRSSSLSDAKAQATAQASQAATTNLRRMQSKSTQSDEALAEYVQRVAVEAESCANPVKGGGFESAVILRMASTLTSPQAQNAFVTAASTPTSARVPAAIGQIVVPSTQTVPKEITVSVAANNPRDGDFVFRFRLEGARNQRSLTLRDIRVNQDGSARTTRWFFAVLVNGTAAATLPEASYTDDKRPPVYQADSKTPLRAMLTTDRSIVEIRGYRR